MGFMELQDWNHLRGPCPPLNHMGFAEGSEMRPWMMPLGVLSPQGFKGPHMKPADGASKASPGPTPNTHAAMPSDLDVCEDIDIIHGAEPVVPGSAAWPPPPSLQKLFPINPGGGEDGPLWALANLDSSSHSTDGIPPPHVPLPTLPPRRAGTVTGSPSSCIHDA